VEDDDGAELIDSLHRGTRDKAPLVGDGRLWARTGTIIVGDPLLY